MPDVQIIGGASAESLRQALQSFGLLSTAEFRRDENSPGVVVLHEVGLGECIQSFLFQSSDERKQQVLAPGQAGVHFVKNPALSLQANRIIVPLS